MNSKNSAENRSGRPLTWSLMQRVDDPDIDRARAQIQEDIKNGATGFAFIFEGAHNAFGYGLPAQTDIFDSLLEGISLERLHLRLDNHPHGSTLTQAFVDYLQKRRIDPSQTKLTFSIDPTAVLATTGKLKMSIEALKATLPQSMSVFFASGIPGIVLEADGRPYHNAGASTAQELGAMLSIALSHFRMIEEARHHIVYALPHIGFATALDQDSIAGIAKLRALRFLWRRLQSMRKVPTPIPATIHVESSMRMMESGDILSNITRTSMAAYSAILGGAASLTLLPHSIALGLPDDDARRIALNTQLIMGTEGLQPLGKSPNRRASDADTLAEAAWEEFERFEKEGGVLQSLMDGKLARRIEEARDLRLTHMLKGGEILIGMDAPVSAPNNILAAKPSRYTADGIAHCEPLEMGRWQIDLTAARKIAPVDMEKTPS